MSRPLIIIRPEPGNAATVGRGRAMGLEAHGVPLFAVEPVAWQADPPDKYVGILLTSANAVRHAGDRLADYIGLPVYAVGTATADAARAAGFGSIVTGDGDIARLMAHIATLGLHRLLHLSGEDVTPFDAQGIKIDRHIVYRAAEAAPPPEFAALAREAVILVHSQRAGARLASLTAEEHRGKIALVAISAAAASQAGEGWQRVAIAPEPRDEAMLRIAAELA